MSGATEPRVDPREATVAVTGLNATDNPGPGVTVLRAIREAPGFRGRIVGLAYDTLEPGIYAPDLVDDVFLVPYPSQGASTLLERLREIHGRLPLDVVVPNLDAELPGFIDVAGELGALGVATFLPTRDQLALRAKTHLHAFGRDAGIQVPRQRLLSDVQEVYGLEDQVPFPVMIKGVYYGALPARSVDEAVAAFHRTAAAWGLPVIAQQQVRGEEFDVVAVGDGAGGLVGAVPMRKTTITDKGKGWAGVAVRDPGLLETTERFMQASRWRGPCEVEVMKGEDGAYHLMEINPRFPAWSYLSAGAGMNLPWAVVRLALGEAVAPMTEFRAGTMFVRIALDQIASIDDLETISTTGELHRGGEG